MTAVATASERTGDTPRDGPEFTVIPSNLVGLLLGPLHISYSDIKFPEFVLFYNIFIFVKPLARNYFCVLLFYNLCVFCRRRTQAHCHQEQGLGGRGCPPGPATAGSPHLGRPRGRGVSLTEKLLYLEGLIDVF